MSLSSMVSPFSVKTPRRCLMDYLEAESPPIVETQEKIKGVLNPNSPCELLREMYYQISPDMKSQSPFPMESDEGLEPTQETSFLRPTARRSLRRYCTEANVLHRNTSPLLKLSMTGLSFCSEKIIEVDEEEADKENMVMGDSMEEQDSLMEISNIPGLLKRKSVRPWSNIMENLSFLPYNKIRRTQSDSQALLSEIFPLENSFAKGRIASENGEIYSLPHIESGKDALKRITPETLVNLVQGRYEGFFDEIFVVDCRFEYEFKGGHIESAINVNSIESLEEMFLKNPPSNRRTIIVFHCEFSSKRAPRMAHHLRSIDRAMNVHNYPHLFYPEIYILEGGYKGFYSSFKECCNPQFYVEMNDISYISDLRKEISNRRVWKRSKSLSDVSHLARYMPK